MTAALAAGRYTIVRRLAQGGMGDVLLADFRGDPTIGLSQGLLVLKRVLQEHPSRLHQATMLREEGRIALRLLHENLVETFFVDEHEGDPLLVMEFLSGRAMSQVLGQAKKRKERIPIEVALAVLRASACGLHFAHTLSDKGRPLGLIHRDVSPANLFVTFDGRVKLIDFGVAKADDSEIRTSTGILKGKLGYMSPEHALGDKLTPATDLWSLGVCFWESLCAERLFATQSPSATMQAISEKPIPSPTIHRPDVPLHIQELCMRLLDRDLATRIPSGAALVAAIDALPEGKTLRKTDFGGWLAGRFPEEAETGRREAGRCARLTRKTPVASGVMQGSVAPSSSGFEKEIPTIVMGPAAAVKARALSRSPEELDAATVRLRLEDGDLPRVSSKVALLADEDEDPQTSENQIPSQLTSEEPEPDPEPDGRTTLNTQRTQVGSETVARTMRGSSTVRVLEKASWVASALLTFGALALAMGVGFSFLPPRVTPRIVAVYEDPARGVQIVVAPRDAPPNAKQVDVTAPTLTLEGARLSASELSRRLEESGVRLRASLPTTTRGTLASLLPVIIAALGLLSLSAAVPPLLLGAPRTQLIGKVLFVTSSLIAIAFAIYFGALSWPGLRAFQDVATLEIKR